MSGGFIQRRKVAKALSQLERTINPDIVFTVFGPSYWRPKTTHVSGFADGWCYNKNSIAFSKLSFKNRIITRLKIKLKNFILKKVTDYLIVETDVARKNTTNELKFPHDKIFVVGNTYSSVFNKTFDQKERISTQKNKGKHFKLLTVSSFYLHKNLFIFNEVTKELKKQNITNFTFYLTIKPEVFKRYFKNNEYVLNLGPQLSKDCPQLYRESDVMILPTLLETFTASYPEAMKMKKPILTSDLDFARDICQDAALYFNPLDAKDISDKIVQIMKDKRLKEELVDKGIKRLESFESSSSRAKKYMNICQGLMEPI